MGSAGLSSPMGEAGRRAMMRNTTPEERFDLGLELSETMMAAVLAHVSVPRDATPEERARIQFRALRRAEA
jgi:hypothetical protein